MLAGLKPGVTIYICFPLSCWKVKQQSTESFQIQYVFNLVTWKEDQARVFKTYINGQISKFRWNLNSIWPEQKNKRTQSESPREQFCKQQVSNELSENPTTELKIGIRQEKRAFNIYMVEFDFLNCLLIKCALLFYDKTLFFCIYYF